MFSHNQENFQAESVKLSRIQVEGIKIFYMESIIITWNKKEILEYFTRKALLNRKTEINQENARSEIREGRNTWPVFVPTQSSKSRKWKQ